MKILLLAGEQSGLLYADALRPLLAVRGHEVRGYADYGFKVADMAVMGFLPVLLRAGYFLRVKRTMERAIDDWRPDVVCTIDYPGLNLKLAAYAKRRGVRAVHVVSPQVWAWKRGRIPRIEAALDRLLCFFPFEPPLYAPGFAAFVGHPLVEAVEGVKRLKGAELREARLVAVLPGSRLGEIARNLPVQLAAVAKLRNVRVEIPAANAEARAAIERIAGQTGAQAADVTIRDGGARELLLRADVAAVASGTATLEAALARCPTALVYRVSPLFAWFARRVIRGVRHIGLANIVWEKARPGDGDFPMPELLQEGFTADALADVLRRWLDDPAARARAVARLEATCRLLDAGDGVMERLAAEITSKGATDHAKPLAS